jgi:hypothetical protein
MTTRTAARARGQLSIEVEGEPLGVGVCHCPICGTSVFHTEEGYEHASVSVAVGAFGDPDFPPPEDSVYHSRRHTWVGLPDGITTHDTDPA